MLSNEEVLKQSEGAMRQWEDIWKKHAVRNGEILRERGYSNQRIFGHGIGRKAICVGFSSGLERKIDELKQANNSVDILCIDKAMGYLLDHGIKPKFVYLADAGVDYEKWCEPYIDQTEDMCLMMNVTANPKWAENWKGKIFYFVNQDNIKTEEIFAPLSGCQELVKASSNVGNSVLVHAATYLLYDEYYLIGYDFSWGQNDNYYCGNDSDKRWYMSHHKLIDTQGKMVSTSQNLLFSARWLSDFIKAVLVPQGKKIFNLSKSGILNIPYFNIRILLSDSTQRVVAQQEIDHVIKNRLQNIKITAEDGVDKLRDVLQNHNVANIIVRHLPEEVI
jgi:hypothetical protein